MTDYQDALVLENLDLVNWVIRTRISIPNRPLLTYDDFYAIGCEAICRAALKYQPDMGAFAPFACRYIYNAIVDHCRAMNYRLERSVEISEDENASLLDMLTCTSVDFDETVTDATAMSALAACKEKYNGVARKGVEAIEMKLKGYEATEIAKHYDTGPDFNVIRLGKVRKVACKCVEQSFEVGVDSGQAGFFDDAFYQNDTVFEELPAPGFAIGDLWYRHVCDITLSKMSAGVLPYGAVSSSGFGDGGYTCYTHADENGVIDFAFIVFI